MRSLHTQVSEEEEKTKEIRINRAKFFIENKGVIDILSFAVCSKLLYKKYLGWITGMDLASR